MVGVAASVTEVVVGSDTVSAAHYSALSTDDRAGMAVLFRKVGFWKAGEPVTVPAVFDGGSAPEAVVEAVRRIVARWITSAYAIDGGTMTVFGTTESPMRSWRDPDVMQLLERHVAYAGR